MKRTLKYISLIIGLCAAFSCEKSEIMRYDISNAAANFKSQSHQFSLKGMTEESKEISLIIEMIGPVADVDRTVDISFSNEGLTSPATEGTDFEFLGAVVKAGALEGELKLKINKLKEGETRKEIRATVRPNDSFREGYPAYVTTTISWSEEYVRPHQEVWHYWYLYFSKYYSRAIHEIYVQLFTEEVELYCRSKVAAEENNLVYQGPYWWQSANRKLFEYVSEYDAAHPDAPLMHSEDWLFYKSYLTADGEGEKTSDKIPTILETLIVL